MNMSIKEVLEELKNLKEYLIRVDGSRFSAGIQEWHVREIAALEIAIAKLENM